MKSFKIYVLEGVTNPDCGACTKSSCVGCPIENTTELTVVDGKFTYDKIKQIIDDGNGKFSVGIFPYQNSHKVILWTGKNVKVKDAEQWLKNKISKSVPFDAVFNYDDWSSSLSIDASRMNLAKGYFKQIKDKLSQILQKNIIAK